MVMVDVLKSGYPTQKDLITFPETKVRVVEKYFPVCLSSHRDYAMLQGEQSSFGCGDRIGQPVWGTDLKDIETKHL